MMDIQIIPNEILYLIAEDNAMTFVQMSAAIPFIGRMMISIGPAILDKYKKIVREDSIVKHYIRTVGGAYELHRSDGPAIISSRGNERRVSWYQWGKLHRVGYPAYISYSRTYDTYHFIWSVRGKSAKSAFVCEKDKYAMYNDGSSNKYCQVDYERNKALMSTFIEFGADECFKKNN